MNLIDIAILAVIALAVYFALRRMIRMRKRGCSCGCSECNGACGSACGKCERPETSAEAKKQ